MDIGRIAGGPQQKDQPQRPGAGPLVVSKGDVLKALVVKVISENKAVLEIAGRTITANTALSLAGLEGKAVLLKSMGSGASGELVLKLAGQAGEEVFSGQTEGLIAQLQSSLETGGATGALLGKLESLLLETFAAGGSPAAGDKQALAGLLVRFLAADGDGFSGKLSGLISMMDSLAEGMGSLSAGNDEALSQKLLAAISSLFPEAEGLTAASLEKAIKGSGILLESRLLAGSAALADGLNNEDPAKAKEKGKGKDALLEGDLKALLLKLKTAFGEEGLAGQKGARLPSTLIDSLLRDMRAFQFISKLTDSLYGFLPARWEGLKDGRLAFKPDGQAGGSCLINLDLEGLGKIAVSVFMRGGEFYVTLRIEDPSFRDAVNGEASGALKEAFSGKGLSLRTVNVTDYEDSPKNHLEFPGEHIISIKL
ncbi:MAG: flagellar hook-length control protein FliK [Nitrospiraceae bacterium]|nr:flagellar hook-length control protein FliK [Nitrospiraceae bacterium]